MGRAVGGFPDFVLEPGAARHLHLGLQADEPVFFQGFHAPEVDGVADAKVVRVSAASSEARAAKQAVYHSLQSPGPVGEEPSSGAADAGEGSVDVRGCRTHLMPPAFDYHTLAGSRRTRPSESSGTSAESLQEVSIRPSSRCLG